MTTQPNAQTENVQQRMGQAGQQAQEKLSQVGPGARESAQRVGQQTGEAFQEFTQEQNPVKGLEAFAERLPANAYFYAAAGSVLLSLLFLLAGKQKAAIFVGLWPPTIVNGAMMMKRLRPSQEL